jgi:serine/threonine protein kinase
MSFLDSSAQILYESKGVLGTGGFAVCYRVVSSLDQKMYALKNIQLKGTPSHRQRVINELTINRQLSLEQVPCETIVQFYRDFLTPNHKSHCLLLEYCTGGSLSERIRKGFTECQLTSIVYDIVSALSHCHSQGIIHRDVKPKNILFVTSMNGDQAVRVKLCDFGLSCCVDNAKGSCGTMQYMAPEILKNRQAFLASDCWALGLVLYKCIYGRLPWQKKLNDKQLQLNLIESTVIRYLQPEHIWYNKFITYIKQLLIYSHTQRITTHNLLSSLTNHDDDGNSSLSGKTSLPT